ncbi:MAG: UDP-N-acetylmuramoyl-L-alanyl-D-glutamate--2,6-diaminopimelate ligase [Deltaproteobacteria bacterium]|nr:UDP-N-acetylmuramoyl-L-alanyl-D-glutamate--2,6-diaminopimelate ligase [Deltaproteobacteria bacterium]
MSPLTLLEISQLLDAEQRSLPNVDAVIHRVVSSSLEAGPGTVFVAVKGSSADGHEYLEQALKAGAEAVIVQDPTRAEGLPFIKVRDTRLALSFLASLLSGRPSDKMNIVGITGTNGKTTTNWIVYHMLLKCGVGSMRIGTLGIEAAIPERGGIFSSPGNLTTPGPLEIHENLKQAHAAGVTSAVMEVSSHALIQSRADHISFDAAIFTNLTRDHLDYHQGMEEYYSAKRRLFALLENSSKSAKRGVINVSCDYGRKLASEVAASGTELITFGQATDADARIGALHQGSFGSKFTLRLLGRELQVHSPYIGYHNAENVVAALLACDFLVDDIERLVDLVAELPQVPGRLESAGNDQISVYVDYAHTPDALKNVIRALRPVTRHRLWVVFGCGGDRDKGKRPVMGQIARSLADVVVVTSDNPRTEDPSAIIEEILEDVRADFVEVDRREAIKIAVSNASPGDVVLIAGKGHEAYQIIGHDKHPFSDVGEVRSLLS